MILNCSNVLRGKTLSFIKQDVLNHYLKFVMLFGFFQSQMQIALTQSSKLPTVATSLKLT